MDIQIIGVIAAGIVGAAVVMSDGNGGSSENSAFVQEMSRVCEMGGGKLAVEGCQCFAEALNDEFDEKTRQFMVVAIQHANDKNPEKAIIRELTKAGFDPSDARDVQRQLLQGFHSALDRCMA